MYVSYDISFRFSCTRFDLDLECFYKFCLKYDILNLHDDSSIGLIVKFLMEVMEWL